MATLGTAAILGLFIDAALGGLAIASGFQEFQKGRDPGETPEQAAAEYARLMLADVIGEQEADNAVNEWLATHAGG